MQENFSGNDIYVRFSVLHRILHFVAMTGFAGLGITGLSLGLSSTLPAKAIMWVLGGASHAASVHRFLAGATYACVIVHSIWFLYYKLLLKGLLTGPHSILPRMQDLKDFSGHLSYFLGRRKKPPAFERFTYMEKIDYWAIFIGMNTMGLTGLILWFPEFFTGFLPGIFINIAQILHFYEAVLAVILKIFIHVGMAHLRPAVYPGDMSVFSGHTTKHKMKEDHPGEWERWVRSKDPVS